MLINLAKSFNSVYRESRKTNVVLKLFKLFIMKVIKVMQSTQSTMNMVI